MLAKIPAYTDCELAYLVGPGVYTKGAPHGGRAKREWSFKNEICCKMKTTVRILRIWKKSIEDKDFRNNRRSLSISDKTFLSRKNVDSFMKVYHQNSRPFFFSILFFFFLGSKQERAKRNVVCEASWSWGIYFKPNIFSNYWKSQVWHWGRSEENFVCGTTCHFLGGVQPLTLWGNHIWMCTARLEFD